MSKKEHKEILQSSKNIAIIRTDKLGDMILTLPMVKVLKSINPNAKIHIIASKYTESILKHSNEVVDGLPLFEYHLTNGEKGSLTQLLNKLEIDTIFYPRPKFDEALEGYKSNAKLRIGTAYRLYSLLFNHRVKEHRKVGKKNEAEYNIGLIESVFDQSEINKFNYKSELLKVQFSTDEIKEFKKKIRDLGINLQKPPIIIHPATGGSAKEWHPRNFGKLAKCISKELSNDIVITGTAEETLQCKQVEVECVYSKNICGKLNLVEMMMLISISGLVVANSTGIIHIAAACDVPVVGLYPNSANIGPTRWGPFTVNKIILTPPILDDDVIRDDLSLIKVSDVFEACKLMLQK